MSVEVLVGLIENYYDYAVAFGVTISASVIIYKKALKPVYKHIIEWYKMVDKIDTIFDELTPNGGTSIKDKVDKIDNEIVLLQQVQQVMLADTKTAHFKTDSNGNCVWVNRTYSRKVGRDISEILGHGWQNTIAEQDRKAVTTEWYKAVEENRDFSMEFNFETPDGELIPSKVRGYKMVGSKGEKLGYWGNCNYLK